MSQTKTILAMAAHADDCPFGIAGTLLKAVGRGHRVVILNLLTRGSDFAQQVADVNTLFGVETITLDFQSGRFELCEETKRATSEVVADIRPNMAFHLWPEDHHPDHVVAAAICRAALRLGGRILDREDFRVVSRIFTYDNGPGHTIDFVPDTFVDVSEEWEPVMEWNGRMSAVYQNVAYDPDEVYYNMRAKEILAAYRGLTCGVRYAEAFWAAGQRPVEIF